MKTLWLMLAQIHHFPASEKLQLPKRIGVQISFLIQNEPPGNHTLFTFPTTLMLAPYPSELGMRFCYDLADSGFDVSTLPSHPEDFEILDIPYPVKFPLDWWDLAKTLHYRKIT